MGITAKGDDARQFLAGLPEFAGGDKPVSQLSDAYANRLARRAQADLVLGRTPSRQAGRGHVTTPEHPGNAAPKLPEPPAVYRERPTPQQVARQTGDGRPPRLRHDRPAFTPYVPYQETGELYTVTTEREAREVLRLAAARGDTIDIQAYDCSRRSYRPVFRHGVSAEWVQGDSAGQSLEAWALNIANSYHGSAGSDVGRTLTHICLWEINIRPRETANVAALRMTRH